VSDPAAGGRSSPEPIRRAVATVRARIEGACRRVGRPVGDVTLVAASKSVPVDVLLAARAAGVAHFAENRAAELAVKARAVEATWHFIGKLQRGTAAHVAQHADVVHSAEPGGALERLARRVALQGRVIDCLIQVDFTGRRQGVLPSEVRAFATRAAVLDGIHVVGLMTLPPFSTDPEHARPYFRNLRTMLDGFWRDFPDMRELSMGMSDDLEIGVEEGATMVRVGSALFGPRPRPGPRSVPGSGQRG
jgi:pyridoxal phosphate enzyme (YggS family)